MKFIKPSQWITPKKNEYDSPLADVYRGAGVGTTIIQAATYPIAAIVSGIGHILTGGK